MPLPSIWPSYARLLAARRPALAPPGSGAVTDAAEARSVVPRAAAVAAYRAVCGFGSHTRLLPLTYPHALASPLHLALLARPACPVRALGLVHVRNTIRALRPLPDGAPLDLRCALEGPRETERGQELDLRTEAHVEGALAWSETAVLLARRAGSGAPRRAPAAAEPGAPGTPGAPHARWSLAADLGRRYAAASGDWNPIHLSAVTARLFGFDRAIAHGMWSLARCVAELAPASEAVTVEAAFKRPVLLPATVALYTAREGATTAFVLTDGEGKTPHVAGTIRAA